MVIKCGIIFGIFVLLGLVLGLDSVDVVPEFQYPCYVDVCTFPKQYCNSDRLERRCNPCDASVCAQERRPKACQYICQQGIKQVSVTSTPQIGQVSNVGSNFESPKQTTLELVMIFSTVMSAIIVLLLVAILIICILKRDKTPSKFFRSPQNSFKSALGGEINQQEVEKLLQLDCVVRCLKEMDQTNNTEDEQIPPPYRPTEVAEGPGNTPTLPVKESDQQGEEFNQARENEWKCNCLKNINPTPDTDANNHHFPEKLSHKRTKGVRPDHIQLSNYSRPSVRKSSSEISTL